MEYIRDLNYTSICIRIFIAVICGGIIGLERGVKGRAAGFRTHILVCVGAALTMMTGQYILINLAPHSDPGRLGAQVISGIGFLGVGTIVTTRTHKVRGLTTAAGLWTSACLGLAIGIGFYEAALIGIITVTVAMIAFQRVDRYFYGNRYIREYCIEIDSIGNIKHVLMKIKEHDYQILETMMEQEKGEHGGSVTLVITIKRQKDQNPEDFLLFISEEKGILFVEEI